MTLAGDALIKNKGYTITYDDLMEFSSFAEFIKPNNKNEEIKTIDDHENIKSITPDDQLIEAFDKIENKLAEDLKNEILNMSSLFFESLVLDLLYKMGYGGKGKNRTIYTDASQECCKHSCDFYQ